MSEKAVETKQKAKKPVARKEMTMWQWTWKEMKRNYVAYLFHYFTCYSFTILQFHDIQHDRSTAVYLP